MGVRKKIKSQGIKQGSARVSPKSGGSGATLQGTDLQGTERGGGRDNSRGNSRSKGDDTDARRDDMRAKIWQVVAMIPPGKVATYGQIAALTGFPSHARFVGRTLGHLPRDTRLPWFRVVNASLRISPRGGGEARQRALLEADGVTFIGARILKHHHWEATAT